MLSPRRKFLALLLLTGCHCYQIPEPEKPPTGSPRSFTNREAASVSVTNTCLELPNLSVGTGSGVIVGPTVVLTAYHVVKCEGTSLVQVDDVLVRVTRVSADADIARLERVAGTWAVPIAQVGPRPKIGESVCLFPVVPTRVAECGVVDGYDSLPGDVSHKAATAPGNSGSGVYDSSGRLVGIVTHFRRSAVGGLASSLEGREWLLH